MIETTELSIGLHGLAGILTLPQGPAGLVIFARESGSGGLYPRHLHAADKFNQLGFATLSFYLLTEAEAGESGRALEVALLGAWLVEAIDWAALDPSTLGLPVVLFGVGAGAMV